MTDPARVTLFHAPNTRSSGALRLLEELGAPYDLHVLDLKAGENRQPAYLAINPTGKVPAVRYGEALVTEQCAITIFLADLFPAAGLAPAIDDPDRGPYLRWIVYYAAAFEPAITDHAMKRDAGPVAMSPYGSYDTVVDTVCDQLARGPYLIGDRRSAADVLWGTALAYMTGFGLMPQRPEVMRFVARMQESPALARVAEIDAKLSAELDAKRVR